MMTYKEYVEKYDLSYGHDNYESGEQMFCKLEELLEHLKDEGYECPNVVNGGIPVKITIDPEIAVDSIEETLWDHDFAGEDYEMTDAGRAFLKKCFMEYNEKYANNGYYCESVDVIVPDEMKYELEEE